MSGQPGPHAAGTVRRLAGREVFANQWLRLREDEVRFADGSRGSYTVVERADFALVVPWTGTGYWLVQQYRYPVGQREWEFPQGGWPHGQGGSSRDLAERELAEETGLRAGRLEHLGRLNSAPGMATSRFDVFLATELIEGEPEREATESDMVHAFVDTARFGEMVRAGQFRDSNSLAALALVELAGRHRR